MKARLKTWVVDTLADAGLASVGAVIVAKIIHRFWGGFRGA